MKADLGWKIKNRQAEGVFERKSRILEDIAFKSDAKYRRFDIGAFSREKSTQDT